MQCTTSLPRPLSDTTLVEQIHSVEGLLNKTYAAVNVEPPSKYFSGLFSERIRQMLGRLDYRMVFGSIYPHDPQIPYWRINARHTEHVTTRRNNYLPWLQEMDGSHAT